MESSDVGGDWEESAGGGGPGKSSGFPSAEGQLLVSFSQVVFEEPMRFLNAIKQTHGSMHTAFLREGYVIFSTFTHNTGLINNIDC